MPRIYEILPGFFAPSPRAGDGQDANPPRFGLLDAADGHWPRFVARVADLQAAAEPGTTHKVLFISRHGQAWHNFARRKHGNEAWFARWAHREGDGELTWGPSAGMTPQGEREAATARARWNVEVSEGLPRPQAVYTSPLRRAMRSTEILYTGLTEAVPTVLENLREDVGTNLDESFQPMPPLTAETAATLVTTYNWRASRSELAASWPHFHFEDGFAELDPMRDVHETGADVISRARSVLDGIFDSDSSTYVALSSHSDIIHGIQAVLGQTPYMLPTAGVVPLVVSAKRL